MLVGIDPGLQGAVAIIHEDYIRVVDMPAESRDIHELMNGIRYASHIFIEMSWPRPVQGVISAFKMGRDFGYMTGQLYGANIIEVSPQSWKKALWPNRVWLKCPKDATPVMRKKMSAERKKQSKTDSLNLARQLYPSMTDHLMREKDEGRAEAILIAHWGSLSIRGV